MRVRKKSLIGLKKKWKTESGKVMGIITLSCVLVTQFLSRYDYHDENLDKQWHRLAMFVFVSLPVLFATLWAYTPDRRMRDWALREVSLHFIIYEYLCLKF